MIGEIDEKYAEEAAPGLKKNRKAAFIRWGATAACLAAAAAAVVLLWPKTKVNRVSIGGIIREYKNVSVNAASSEEAIIWPWEYRTVEERYSSILFEGREYIIKSSKAAADEAYIGESLGTGEGVGYDIYTEEEHRQNFEVREIRNISKELMVAAEMEGQYYIFQNDAYMPPASLGEMLDDYSLKTHLALNRFSVLQEGIQTGYYSLPDDQRIWQILDGCRDAEFVEDEAGGSISRNRITFTATSASLGSYKRAFYISDDGYVSTNIFNWAYTFCIGEEAAKEIISYAESNGVSTEAEPYLYSVAGTLTEIGDGYLLVDDTILCADQSDGMVFRVMTDDIRIRRTIEFQKIETGSVVVVSFTEPVRAEGGNTVYGAISMAKGYLTGDGVAVPE